MGQSGFLNKEVFKRKMTELILAFNCEMKPEALGVYWEHMHKSFSDESFSNAVDDIILSDNYFPRISRFFQVAKAVTREEILRKWGVIDDE